MLQKSVGDHCHESVAVEASPRSTFEMVEAEFFLELLVSLLANPTRLDGRCERFEAGVGGKVGEIVFLFARCAALADEPYLLARHVLHALVVDPLGRTVGDTHANRGEASFQRTLRPLAPTERAPLRLGENVFGRH